MFVDEATQGGQVFSWPPKIDKAGVKDVVELKVLRL